MVDPIQRIGIQTNTQGIKNNGNEPVSQSDLERIATSLANNELSGDDVMTVKNLDDDRKELLVELLEQKGVLQDSPLLKILHAVVDLLHKFESDSPEIEQLKAQVIGQALFELGEEYRQGVETGEIVVEADKRDAYTDNAHIEMGPGYDQLVGRRAAEILIAKCLEDPSTLEAFEASNPMEYTALVLDPTLVGNLRKTYEGEE